MSAGGERWGGSRGFYGHRPLTVCDEAGRIVAAEMHSLIRYAVGLLAAVLAAVVCYALVPLWGTAHPFLTFYPAVMVAAWFGGLGAGLVATAVAGAVVWYFLPLGGWPNLLAWGSFMVTNILITGLTESLRRARRRAELAGDASGQRQARERVRNLLTFNQAVMANMGEGLYTVDTQGAVTFINPAAQRLFGWTAAELQGRTMHDVTHYLRPDGSPFPAEECVGLQVLRHGSAIKDHEDVFIRKDGTFFPVVYSCSRIVSEGRTAGLVVVFRDVTEAKRTEAEREELLAITERARVEAESASATTRALQRVVDATIADLSLDDLLQEVLERVRETVSADTALILLRQQEGREEVLRVRMAVGLDEEAQRDTRVPMGTGFAGRIAADRTALVWDDVDYARTVSPFIRSKGVRSLAGVPLLTGERLIGVLHVAGQRPAQFQPDDVELLRVAAERIALAIERAAARDAEREARGAAEAASRTKDEFLSVLSHELRTPLASMTNWLRVLRVGTDKGLRARALDSMERNIRAQTKLVEDLLDVSRIVTGRLRLDLQPVDLATVVRAAIETIAPAAEAKGVRVETALNGTPVVVAGDADRLQQIAWNLLSNAVKFTPGGGHVAVQLLPEGAHVRLVVRDTGRGIQGTFLPRAFERFQQAEPAESRRYGGLGLGLAITRHLTELHGGTVAVESAGEGRGTTLTVSLPLLGAPMSPTEGR